MTATQADATAPSIALTGLFRYPVKSCRGEAVPAGRVEPWGLAGDRRWMLVDPEGVTLTARQSPRLVLVVPQVTDVGLVLTAPGMPDLAVAAPGPGSLVPVSVWGTPFDAALAAPEASAWFSEVAGRPVRLVYLDDPRRRPIDPTYSRPGEVVSMADGFPMLLASQSSLDELNGWIAEGARSADGPLPMARFRPNLVVAGAPAWAEDRWRRVRIGTTTFRAVKACERCVLTLIDPETGGKTKEPLYSLARHRQWDHKTWFAVNLIADDHGGTLHPGDPVEVLEEADEPGPQR